MVSEKYPPPTPPNSDKGMHDSRSEIKTNYAPSYIIKKIPHKCLVIEIFNALIYI